jgi:Trk-type K+ transport system membrane component
VNGALRLAARRPVLGAVLGLVAVVIAGTGLLLLPGTRAGGGSAPLLVALFSATSAVCASGLAVVDTGSYWSGFGQAVLVVLMQVGGLAVMIVTSLLALTVAERLGLSTRLLADSGTGGLTPRTIRRVVRGTVVLALSIEAASVLVLTLRLWLAHGYPVGRAVWYAIFHSVSAFTNCGLTLWQDSLIGLGPDTLMLLLLAVGFVLGGLGYPVLLELATVRPSFRWSLHTKLTLSATGLLAVLGPAVVLLTEWTNPATLGRLAPSGRVVEGVFAGLSPRSAGLATLDFSAARPASRLAVDLLMLIGGGSGSTAGGVKVTTVAVLALAVAAEVRGRRDVDVMGRRIGSGTVRQAIAVVSIAAATVATGTFALLAISGAGLDQVLFEVSSAFGSSGLTTGLTEQLPDSGRLVMIVLTLTGRIGPIAVGTALALRQTRRAFRYTQARPVIG